MLSKSSLLHKTKPDLLDKKIKDVTKLMVNALQSQSYDSLRPVIALILNVPPEKLAKISQDNLEDPVQDFTPFLSSFIKQQVKKNQEIDALKAEIKKLKEKHSSQDKNKDTVEKKEKAEIIFTPNTQNNKKNKNETQIKFKNS